jgi:hypothetical protein
MITLAVPSQNAQPSHEKNLETIVQKSDQLSGILADIELDFDRGAVSGLTYEFATAKIAAIAYLDLACDGTAHDRLGLALRSLAECTSLTIVPSHAFAFCASSY